jgi:hypothetical protein
MELQAKFKIKQHNIETNTFGWIVFIHAKTHEIYGIVSVGKPNLPPVNYPKGYH